MRGRPQWRDACVTRALTIAEGVRMVEFAVEGALPAFEPGSHVQVQVDIGGATALRSYTCLPSGPGRIRVAVRRHANSRGGSRFMWSLIEGARLRLTVPVNRFELSWRAPHYLLAAGGIGITPIYGMALALTGRNASVRLAYGGRSAAEMAFTEELGDLLGDRAAFYRSDQGARMDLGAEIAALPDDGELYICGPVAMMEEARTHWQRAGRSVSRFRCEVFGDSGLLPERPFMVEVANANVRVEVRPDESMLDALLSAGVDMIYECERGECGLCAVDIVRADGEIDHRDVFFSPEEKRSNARMCACVSRLSGGTVVVDTGHRPATGHASASASPGLRLEGSTV